MVKNQGQIPDLKFGLRIISIAAAGVGGELKSYARWRVGENESFSILIGEGFFSSKVLAIDKGLKKLIHSHKVGIIGKLFGRR